MSLTYKLGLEPPLTIKFHEITPLQDEVARKGICPHCHTKTLADKHASEDIRFLQCSRCLVVVAINR